MNKYLKPITYISMTIIFINTVLPFLIWLLLEITGVIFDNTFMSEKFIFNWFSILNIHLLLFTIVPSEIWLFYAYKKKLFMNKPINDIIIISVVLGAIPLVFWELAYTCMR